MCYVTYIYEYNDTGWLITNEFINNMNFDKNVFVLVLYNIQYIKQTKYKTKN